MNPLLTALIAILVFGFLIFIHEFGHYIFARIFGVAIKEFSIGMGPKLLWYDSKKTGITYKVCAFPIGGYVAMEGEDGESQNPNSFDKKPAWQRFIIVAAGGVVNLLMGVLIVAVMLTQVDLIGLAQIHSFEENAVSSQHLQAGDKIEKIKFF